MTSTILSVGTLTQLAMEDLDYAVNDLREDRAAYFTGRVEDQSAIRREQTIGTNITRLTKPADLEINLGEGNCISISDRLAGDLTQDAVLSLKFGQDQCRSPPRSELSRFRDGEISGPGLRRG